MNRKAFHQYLYSGEQLYSVPSGLSNKSDDGLSGFIVLVDGPEQISAEDKDLLGKILEAIGKDATSTSTLYASQVKKGNLGNATILAFLNNNNASQLGLSDHFAISNYGDARVILSPPLSDLHESKDMKISLWSELKKLRD